MNNNKILEMSIVAVMEEVPSLALDFLISLATTLLLVSIQEVIPLNLILFYKIHYLVFNFFNKKIENFIIPVFKKYQIQYVSKFFQRHNIDTPLS